jgi:hypothetical protein
VPTVPCTPEYRSFLEEVDARFLLLHQAIKRGSAIETNEILNGIAHDGLLTSDFLKDLLLANPWFRQRLSGKVEKLTRRGLPKQPAQSGRVLLPVIILASEQKLLSEDLVLTRRLTCQVDAKQNLSLVSADIAPWGSNLRRICDLVARVVIGFAPRAARNWHIGHVSFDLYSTGARHAKGHSVSSVDRSYELAAAVALTSACFAKALSPGIAAMGLVDDVGAVKPIPDDLLVAKCHGLAADFPPLEYVLVPRTQATLAKDHLPPTVRVLSVHRIDELPDILEIEPEQYVGRRRVSVVARAVSACGALLSAASGRARTSGEMRADEAMRVLAGKGYGACIALAAVGGCISLARVEVHIRNYLSHSHLGQLDARFSWGATAVNVFACQVLPHVFLGIVLPVLAVFEGLLVGAGLLRRAPRLLAKWPKVASFAVMTLAPALKSQDTKWSAEYVSDAGSTALTILVFELFLLVPFGLSFTVGWFPVEGWIGKCIQIALLWLVSWGGWRWTSKGEDINCIQFCKGARTEAMSIVTIAGWTFVLAGEVFLLAALPFQMAAIFLAHAQFRPSDRGIGRQQIRSSAVTALAGVRGLSVLALLLSILAICSGAWLSPEFPRLSAVLDLRFLLTKAPSSVPLWLLGAMCIVVWRGASRWRRAFLERYGYSGSTDKRRRPDRALSDNDDV